MSGSNMSRRQGAGRLTSFIMLAIITLLFSYSFILTVHYRIPGKIISRINNDSQKTSIALQNALENNFLPHEARKKADVIMLGDSITYGAQWNEYYPDITIFNRGIGGDTTAGVISRLGTIIGEKPDRIFLMIGLNDILAGKSNDYIVSNTIHIARKIKDSNIKPYVQSILYTERSYRYLSPTSKEINSAIRAINKEVSIQCRQNGIAYIDINKLLADEDGFLKTGYSHDGLHPNVKGYAIWVDELRKQMTTPQ